MLSKERPEKSWGRGRGRIYSPIENLLKGLHAMSDNPPSGAPLPPSPFPDSSLQFCALQDLTAERFMLQAGCFSESIVEHSNLH